MQNNEQQMVTMPFQSAQTLVMSFQFDSPLVQSLSVQQVNAVRQLLGTINFPKLEEEPTAVDGNKKEGE